MVAEFGDACRAAGDLSVAVEAGLSPYQSPGTGPPYIALRACDLPRYRQHTVSTPGAGMLRSAGPSLQVPAARGRSGPEGKERP